jgi:hypothetical protein
VNVTGIEPATPCLQARFQALLKSMKFCGSEEIDNKPLAARVLKSTEPVDVKCFHSYKIICTAPRTAAHWACRNH